MKVVQTLGRHGGIVSGVFQYKRNAAGIVIDGAIGQAALNPPQVALSSAEWQRILDIIEKHANATYRLTSPGAGVAPQPPFVGLYDLIDAAVPAPAAGWAWKDSWKAYVCAILEHEGSVDLYHGVLGGGHTACITVARDIP